MQRITIIGNGAGGKTTLARALGEVLKLPVHHVDRMQFAAGGRRTPRAQLEEVIAGLVRGDRWIIEGLGSRGSIERRCRAADTVILLDFALLTHYVWAARRQWRSRTHRRPELPADFGEFTLRYTWELGVGIWRAHRFYRRFFLDLVRDLPRTTAVVHLRSTRERDAWLSSVAHGR